MAQTGDPTGTGSGGSKLPDLPAEFTREPYKRGSIGAARTQDPNSANSQFFICYEGCRPLTGQYTLWGEVIEGMEHVDKIARGEPPARPDVMQKVYLLSDAEEVTSVSLSPPCRRHVFDMTGRGSWRSHASGMR